MWQVISNSLDIDFIHGDIHGRSCKKLLIFHTSLSESRENDALYTFQLSSYRP